MKNWSYTIQEGEHKGKTLWSGRYCAVAAFVFKQINGEWCVLANQRGKGTPDFQGLWNCPCGFLEADETAEQGCSREVKEETGINIPDKYFKLVGVETDPAVCNNGNVTLRYTMVFNPGDTVEIASVDQLEGGEEDEVGAIEWIPIHQVKWYQWAFNHDKRILEIFGNAI